jgi:hypothetical protein
VPQAVRGRPRTADFDHLSLNWKRRRTRLRRGADLNRRDPSFCACFRAFTRISFLRREALAGKTMFTEDDFSRGLAVDVKVSLTAAGSFPRTGCSPRNELVCVSTRKRSGYG